MPSGMEKLCCLRKLPIHIAGEPKTSQKQGVTNQLEELKALPNLKGHQIRMLVPESVTYVRENGRKVRCLSKDLNHIIIKFLWAGEEKKKKTE